MYSPLHLYSNVYSQPLYKFIKFDFWSISGSMLFVWLATERNKTFAIFCVVYIKNVTDSLNFADHVLTIIYFIAHRLRKGTIGLLSSRATVVSYQCLLVIALPLYCTAVVSTSWRVVSWSYCTAAVSSHCHLEWCILAEFSFPGDSTVKLNIIQVYYCISYILLYQKDVV